MWNLSNARKLRKSNVVGGIDSENKKRVIGRYRGLL